ncbi:hypothetical protein [Bradyrhizobium sp. CB2312]|uniref:hypothetical protein n=1 Tax=Bradyrhizobium sp. CB2312 TaxID=3039155 RepID=UPI0024B182AA|nr:hypothetical protein [Bradyrhizobium sp. CB2312]WFU77236.1 hypothetical protein QA642_25285 [Bradyrhizobium sp. CB2312]
MATASGASQRRTDQRRGSSGGAVSKCAAEVSALIIPAMVLKTGSAAGRILMYSYHIVAELRQFRGVSAVAGRRIHRPVLKRDGMKVNYHRALGYCLSMIFSENRYALFRIMLELAGTDCRLPA